MRRKMTIKVLFVLFISLFVNFDEVGAEKITREYAKDGSVASPFVIQYDTDTKKYELGVSLHGYGAEHNLEYNGNKYMLGTYFYKGNGTTSYDYTLYLNESEKPIELTSSDSLEIYYCISKEIGGGNYSNGTKYVNIFSDEVQYEKYKEELEQKMTTCNFLKSIEVRDNVEGVENKSECYTYYTYYIDIDDFYNKYNSSGKNVSYIGEANKVIEKLKSICNSITKYSNFGESHCLDSCLNLKTDIFELKKKYNIKEYSVNEICGFSEKLLLYIANIVKWVKYIIPVIVIVLGILDFIKAIASEKDDEMKKAQGSFIKRLIAAALIFIVPFIIEFILDKMGFDANGCGIIDL